MATKFRFEFPPDVQALREPVLEAIRDAMFHGELADVQKALELSSEWLAQHPEDFAVLDAGSDLTRLEQAMLMTRETPSAAAK